VSVDLDEITEYLAIHGLPEGSASNAHAVYDVAVPRLLRWARRVSIPLTLFVIGRDCRREATSVQLRAAAAVGHELGNHSLDHRYDLTRLPAAEIHRQVTEPQRVIEAMTGQVPMGFRAPGYTMTDSLLSALVAAGLRYDSSVFPCPSYYAAKLGALATMRVRGRASRSVADDPRVLLAPTEPYFVNRSHREPVSRGSARLVEVPIRVVGSARLPFIGTALTLAPELVFRTLLRAAANERTMNLELHGIDFLDENDVPGPLTRHQPDLRVPVARKLDRLSRTVAALRGEGFRFGTLAELAEATAKSG
jgi:peptidoglycan/xylan/chitin deacetylase (PgdA/CDA1 family)